MWDRNHLHVGHVLQQVFDPGFFVLLLQDTAETPFKAQCGRTSRANRFSTQRTGPVCRKDFQEIGQGLDPSKHAFIELVRELLLFGFAQQIRTPDIADEQKVSCEHAPGRVRTAGFVEQQYGDVFGCVTGNMPKLEPK